MKKETIVRVSLKDLPDLPRDAVDWGRIDSMSEADLERAIAEDPDADVPGIDWDSADVYVAGRKVAISIRLDDDVLAFFKEGGAGYQKRINAVLRSYMTHAMKRRQKRKSAAE